MKQRMRLQERLGRAFAAHAMRVATPENAEWIRAMICEQEYVSSDTAVLIWALGSVFVSYRGRLDAMTRSPNLPRWLLLTVLLLCLGPACACFIFVAVSAAQGYQLIAMSAYSAIQEGLIFGSSALIGPLGIVATFWTLSSSLHRLGKTLMVVLWLLAAWAFAIYIALLALLQSAHMLGGLLAVWVMLFASFVVLPAFAVAQLQWLDTRRPPASAGS